MSQDEEEQTGPLIDESIDPAMAQVVQPERDHFPLCVVWMPLPVLTWFIPFIGHAGIATSRGTIHDFVGSHMINKHPHRMGFGRVTKYWRISLDDIKSVSFLRALARAQGDHAVEDQLEMNRSSAEGVSDDTLIRAWDESIELASGKFRYENHNILANNCHDHVSEALDRLNFRGISHWNTAKLTVYLMLYGKFVSFPRFLATWLPLLIVAGIIVAIALLVKFA